MDGKKSIGPALVGIVVSLVVAAGGAWGLYYWWNKTRTPEVVQFTMAPPPPPAAPKIGAPNPANNQTPGAPRIPNTLGNPTPRPAAAQTGAPADISPIVIGLVGNDPKAKQTAVDNLRNLAAADPRSMEVGLPSFIQPLLMNGNYKDVEEMSQRAILDRSYDMKVVPPAQQARATAFFSEGNFATALVEAKCNFNVSELAANDVALALFNKAASKASGVASPFDPKSVKVQATDYETMAAVMEGRRQSNGKIAYNYALGAGNLLLLADHPDDAKASFIDACKNSAGNARNIRLAIEGVGRALRASAQDVGPAKSYIIGLADDPSKDGPALQDNDMPSLDEIRAAAAQIISQAHYR
jgi:hypothetical protein